MEMFKKTIFDHIFVGREKEKLGEKDSGERDRQMDRYTDPSDQWTDEQTNRQISGRYVIDINMDYTLQCCNLLFFINIKDMNLFIDE